MIKTQNEIKVITIGDGTTSVGVYSDENNCNPCLTLGCMCDKKKIGANLYAELKAVEKSLAVVIEFKNLEGLQVVQQALTMIESMITEKL